MFLHTSTSLLEKNKNTTASPGSAKRQSGLYAVVKLSFLFLVLFLALLKLSYSTSISACQTLSSSGSYVLTANVSSASYCFNITASKVVLDCNYHSISSTYTAVVIKSPYVEVKNCYIKDSFEGVLSLEDYNTVSNIHGDNIATNVVTVRYGDKNTISNIYATNSQIGLSLTNTQDTEASNVECYNTSWYCTYIMNSLNTEVKELVSHNSTKYSAYLKDSLNITLNGGELREGELAGVMIQNTNSSTIEGLTIANTSKGVYITDASTNNNITSNYIENNTYGVYVVGAEDNNIFNNVIINDINAYSDSQNNWNITKTCGVRNLVRGWCVGGNFWGNYSKTEVSDTCSDNNGDGLCDSSTYSFQTYTDYLPMSRYVDLNLHASPSRVDKRYVNSVTIYGKAILMPYHTLVTSQAIDVYVNGKYEDTKITTSTADFSDTLPVPSGAYMEVKSNTTYLTLYSYDIVNVTIAPYNIYLYLYAPETDTKIYDKKGFGLVDEGNGEVIISSSPTYPSSMTKTATYLKVGIPSTNNIILAYTKSLTPYKIYKRVKELKDAAYKDICNFNIGYTLSKDCYAYITLDYSSKSFKLSSTIINLLAGNYNIKIRKTAANTITISR